MRALLPFRLGTNKAAATTIGEHGRFQLESVALGDGFGHCGFVRRRADGL